MKTTTITRKQMLGKAKGIPERLLIPLFISGLFESTAGERTASWNLTVNRDKAGLVESFRIKEL